MLNLEAVPASRYAHLNRIQRNRTFSIASIDAIAAIEAVKQELANVIEEGETIRCFTARAAAVLSRFGLPPLDKKKAAEVLHQYSMLAYSYRNRQGMMDKAVLSVMPYWQFRTCADGAVCRVCSSLDLFTAKWDDEVWNALFPPLDRKCRCTVIALSADEIEPDSDRPGIDRLPEVARAYVAAEQ